MRSRTTRLSSPGGHRQTRAALCDRDPLVQHASGATSYVLVSSVTLRFLVLAGSTTGHDTRLVRSRPRADARVRYRTGTIEISVRCNFANQPGDLQCKALASCLKKL
jgi:hypothetical protein